MCWEGVGGDETPRHVDQRKQLLKSCIVSQFCSWPQIGGNHGHFHTKKHAEMLWHQRLHMTTAFTSYPDFERTEYACDRTRVEYAE